MNKTSRINTAWTDYNATQEKKRPAKGRFVDIVNNKKDKLCVSLVANGRSNHCVRKLCGDNYSDGMIRYRCEQADVNRRDYRDGITRPYTRMTLGIEKSADFQSALEKHLRRTVPHLFNKKHTEK